MIATKSQPRIVVVLVALAAAIAGTVWAAPPASAATYTVTIKGVVSCNSTSKGVQGIWVQNFNGTSKWASWWAFPGRKNVAKYSVTLTATRTDPLLRLDIGCGGTKSSWEKTLLTNDFRTRNGYIENRDCDVSKANRARACSPAPVGTKQSSNTKAWGWCTWGAVEKWKAFTGYYPNIPGDAKDMDTNAVNKGFRVRTEPRPASMIVFNDTSRYSQWGHIGWVTDVTKDSQGRLVIKYTDMNGSSGYFGKWANRTVLWESHQRFILAPT